MAPKTWLVTGCSSGFGEDLIYALLKRGDVAIATGRGDVSRLSTLKDAGARVYSLDVTDPLPDIKKILAKILDDVGSIDVLVNNAGYIHGGMIEELSEEAWLSCFQTNLFGTAKVTQAVLPHLREKRSGVIVNIGSVAGWYGSQASAAYSGTKHALEAFQECLCEEIAPFGIKSILFEPGFFRTGVFRQGTVKWATGNMVSDLDGARTGVQDFVSASHEKQPGDPKKFVQLMIDIVNGERVAKGKEMPLRLPVGRDSLAVVRNRCEKTLELVKDWEDVICSTDFDVA